MKPIPQQQQQQQPAPVIQDRGGQQGPQVVVPVNGVPTIMSETQFLAQTAKMDREDRVYDLESDPQLAAFMADLAEANGQHQQAAKIRGIPYDSSFSGSLGEIWDKQLRVKHIVVAALVVGGLYLVYSGIAYYWSLPGGVFGQKPEEALDEVKKSFRKAV